MARTPQEIFQSHVTAIGAGDVDAVVADYAEDAVLITPDGVTRGRDGIRQVFTSLLGDLPDAQWTAPTQVYEGDVLFVEWTAVAEKARAEGVDTFVFSGNSIRVQTVRLTLERTP
ncbi:nuclear transport factor 2 family protein [Geodermatophilus sabuli]|uniref:SnoaL-like domain-containing protein n=1 Tax=Geodermatophilus sabuli TaxID=1564158 RepID=A0A285EG27_9ACTN|nr:nuclear transport factor 2 family protein [Geodermatophilus sabuli]MBB3086555.1 ketosteroid isomerase-like protein [Geodermatophilus sabuli]SNX97793.1 SnoaL-like domain-containing protein [Geodermatophilus sabuli]